MLTLVSTSLAADFRQNNWADTREQVEAIEGELTPISEYAGIYERELSGVPVFVSYMFTKSGKLARGVYAPRVDGIDPFYQWMPILEEKYGTGTNRHILYSDNPMGYSGGRREKENGIAMGYFELITTWDTPTTLIILKAMKSGMDYNVGTILMYISKEYNPELESDSGDYRQKGF